MRNEFKEGYYLAVANIVRTHGETTIAEDVLKEYGAVDFSGIDPVDAKVLEPIAREIKRKGAHYRMKTLLSILILTLALSPPLHAQCPKEAVSCGAYASIGIYRQSGYAVGPGTVVLGEPLLIQMFVCSYGWDFWHDAPMACFGGGTLALNCAGQITDLTPDDGVSLIGPGACGAAPFVRSKAMRYTVTPADVQAGRVVMRGYYAGGTADLWRPTPIGASCVALVRVRP